MTAASRWSDLQGGTPIKGDAGAHNQPRQARERSRSPSRHQNARNERVRTAEAARRLRPDLKVVLTSGYLAEALRLPGRGNPGTRHWQQRSPARHLARDHRRQQLGRLLRITRAAKGNRRELWGRGDPAAAGRRGSLGCAHGILPHRRPHPGLPRGLSERSGRSGRPPCRSGRRTGASP